MVIPTLPASLWRDTALDEPPGLALTQNINCDIAIVGGGYTGIHAALAFANAGMKVVVLEAGPIGAGGSGRNGGVVSAKFRRGFQDLAGAHGLEMARRMHDIAIGSVDHMFATIERLNLHDTNFKRVGALKCAHSQKAFDQARYEADWLRKNLGVSGLHVLNASAVAAETGSNTFMGGVLQETAGTVQPLAYLRGLWGAARAHGIQAYENTPVISVAEEGNRVLLSTAHAKLNAGQILLATNAYSGLTGVDRAIARGMVPFRSAMIATERLPEDLSALLMPNARSYTESRRMMRWFRKVDGRVLFGGRGALGHVEAPSAFRRLEKAMWTIFPELRGVPITYQWSGRVALTFDGMPQAGMLSARVGYALGFNGAGVAMSGFVGDQIARRMIGQPHDLGLILRASLHRVPFYPIRAVGVRAVTYAYEVMDAAGL